MLGKLKKAIIKKNEEEKGDTPDDEIRVAQLLESNDTDMSNVLNQGITDMMGIIAADVDPTERDMGFMMDGIGKERVFQPIYITRGGWPRKIQTACFHTLIHCPDTDVTFYFEKVKRKKAIRDLQKKTTILRTNLNMELKRGNNDQIHDLTTKIHDIDVLQGEIQIAMNDLFHVSVLANIYADNEDDLETISSELLDSLAGDNFNARVAYNRVRNGYVSALPLGRNYIPEAKRNLDRYAAASLFPFATNDLSFSGAGSIPWGINRMTGNYVFYDSFSRKNPNYNLSIFGVSGSGKSFALKLLTARGLIEDVSTVLIDPEGEGRSMVKQLGGIYVTLVDEKLSNKPTITINPCALWPSVLVLDDEEDEELQHIDPTKCEIFTDASGRTFVRFVAINEKVNDIVGFFDMLVRDKEKQGLNTFERDFIEQAIVKVFKKRGFDEHPSSLYEDSFSQGGVIHMEKVKKKEVTISDIYNQLMIDFRNDPRADELLSAIRPALRSRLEVDNETKEEVEIRGSMSLFDGQSYFGEGVETSLEDNMLIGFDLSALESNERLQQLSYFVIFNWSWEKFVKGNPIRKKRIFCDEAWKLVDSEISVNFMEKCARRARKRNTSLTIASQDFQRLASNEKARGVISNCHSVFFMRQDTLNKDLVKQTFNLSEGEISRVLGEIPPGEGILRVGNESVWMRTYATPEEAMFLESNLAVKEGMKQQAKEQASSAV